MLDCGLFTIAFAMAICGGQRPEGQMFDAKRMRQPLLQCLEDGIMRQLRSLAATAARTRRVST